MRRKIFARILALMAALVASSITLLALFAVREQRALHQDNALEKARILARQIEPSRLWDDRVAIREALLHVVDSQSGIRYAFVEDRGEVIAHAFATGVPQGLVGASVGPVPAMRELRDERGRIFYDLTATMEHDLATVHLGLDRAHADRDALPIIAYLAAFGGLLLLLLVYPAWSVAGSITAEVTSVTVRLEQANKELEARVAARTAELAGANTRLDKERETLAVTLRSIGDGVITTNTEGRITLLNAAAEELTGWKASEAMGRLLSDVLVIVDRSSRSPVPAPLAEVIRTDTVAGLPRQAMLVAKNGVERLIADSMAPIHDKDSHIIGAVLVFRDVTEQERLDTELQRAEKLESIGALAAGIAHDFNNVLTAILGHLNLAALQAAGTDSVSVDLKHAEEATLRARDLAKRLLTFAKGNAPMKAASDIERIVREAADLAMSGSHARCAFHFQSDLPSVDVDAGQINQVIHNLLVNADQAMPDGGEISVRCQTVLADNQPGLPLAPGLYVRVTVEDHGLGIPAENLLKIYDPFFTTKPKGSGLGLAVVHSIVKRHGGYVDVTSRVGSGTTFSIYLPTTQEGPAEDRPEAQAVAGGVGRILVMDDEPLVREVLGRMLVRMGYRVDRAAHGEEAIAMCERAQEAGDPFVLLVLDLTIPGGLGGRETLHRLRRAEIRVPAIASSGYASDPIMADPAAFGFAAAIGKPYDIFQLCHTVRATVIASRSETADVPAEASASVAQG
jgi:PAS domain S-box-containing protein